LVNVFWGEAEHKVLYKNYKYLLSENLFRDIMYSLKENLQMVDKQLMILYNHLKELDEADIEKRKEQLETILSKIIYDIYSDKTKKEFGNCTGLQEVLRYIGILCVETKWKSRANGL